MTAIVAMSRNRVIGRDGKLPWHLSADLQFFKRTTMGHTIVMGRKTFESIGRPLPGRRNVVLSRPGSTWRAPGGVELIHGAKEIPVPQTAEEKIFLIGGGSLYGELLPQCEDMFLTMIDRDVDGDTFMPAFEKYFMEAREVERGEGYKILHYVRMKGKSRK